MESEALIEFGKPLERLKSQTPTPKGKEVLLKITYGGVCHSDVHIQDGYFDLGGGNKLPLGAITILLSFMLSHDAHQLKLLGVMILWSQCDIIVKSIIDELFSENTISFPINLDLHQAMSSEKNKNFNLENLDLK